MTAVAPTLSYCVVNTNGREFLLACLAAIERTHPAGVEREILVLDNASEDGSAEAVRALGGDIRLIALERRTGKAENDSTAAATRRRGRYCLLLNEDSELRPGAAAALIAALDADPTAAAAGPQLLDSDGAPVPCAWRFPGVGTALAGALFLHRWLTVQSSGQRDPPGRLGPVERPDGAPRGGRRRSATSTPTSSSTTTSATSPSASPTPAGTTLFVPAAEAVHHDQLSTDLAAGLPRIVEFHRNRDLYMRKHHCRAGGARRPRPDRLVLRRSRALAATVLPDQPAARLPGPTPARRSSPPGARACATGPAASESPVRGSRVASRLPGGPSPSTSQARVLVHALRLVDLGDRPSTAARRG